MNLVCVCVCVCEHALETRVCVQNAKVYINT